MSYNNFISFYNTHVLQTIIQNKGNEDVNQDGNVDEKDTNLNKQLEKYDSEEQLQGKIDKLKVKKLTYDINGDGKTDINDLLIAYKGINFYHKESDSNKNAQNILSDEEMDILDFDKDGVVSDDELQFIEDNIELISDKTIGAGKSLELSEDGSYILTTYTNDSKTEVSKTAKYNADGKITESKNYSTNLTTTYSYDGDKLVSSETRANSENDTEAGALKNVTTYDSNGKSKTNVKYNDDGTVKNYTVYERNSNGQIVNAKVYSNDTNDAELLSDWSYDEYNSAGKVLKKHDAITGTEVIYTYDSTGKKLASKEVQNIGEANDYKKYYNSDGTCSRCEKNNHVILYEYENGIKSKATAYNSDDFDDNGNLKDGAEPIAVTTYENGLKKETVRGDITTTYTYDNGELVTKTKNKKYDNGETLQIVYNYKNGVKDNTTVSLLDANNKTIEKTSRKYDPETNTVTEKTVEKYDPETNEVTEKSKTEYKKDADGNTLKVVYNYKNGIKDNTTVTKYDENNNIVEKTTRKYDPETNEVTEKSKTEYKKDADGNTLKIVYNYKNGVKDNTTVTKYDENNNIVEKTTRKYDSETKEVTEKTVEKYDPETQKITTKTIKNNEGTKTFTYLEYDGDFPTKYTVDVNLKSGIHTESEITQKLIDKVTYIESAKNYQYINGNKLLVSELETFYDENDTNKENPQGTNRTFNFYDENGRLIKQEKTKSYNIIKRNKNNEVTKIRTNSKFQVEDKIITTLDPDTGLKTSEITYTKDNIITTYYESDGKTVKETKTETYKDNSYGEHNVNGVSREDVINEIKKYYGYDREDGSYSIFGTNGSACATFATYILYQLGFDLTSLATRNTADIRRQAMAEGRYTSSAKAFKKLENGVDIKDIIKPGDILTRSEYDGGGYHTVFVENATYDKDTGIITVVGIGFWGEETYYLKQENGKILYGIPQENGEMKWDDNHKVGFADYIS